MIFNKKTYYFFAILALVVTSNGLTYSDESNDLKNVYPNFSNCDCPVVNIECFNRALKNKCTGEMSACAMPSKCQMFIENKECGILQLTSGKYNFYNLAKKMQCKWPELESFNQNNNESTDANLEKTSENLTSFVYACSMLNHELMHLCKGKEMEAKYGKKSYACQEFLGTLSETRIKSNAVETYCNNPEERKDKSKSLIPCIYLCTHAYENALITNWNKCSCEKVDNDVKSLFGEYLTNDECCQCNKVCNSLDLSHGKEWIPKYCFEEIFALEPVKEAIKELQNQFCSRFLNTNGTYSCSSFAKIPRAPFAECK